VRLLAANGVTLRKARDTLEKLASELPVAIEVTTENAENFVAEINSLGVAGTILVRPEVSVRAVREKFGISQGEFAIRFGFEADTIQNWEQGRNSPDHATKILLSIIGARPDIVEESLTAWKTAVQNADRVAGAVQALNESAFHQVPTLKLSPVLANVTVADISTVLQSRITEAFRSVVEAEAVVLGQPVLKTNRPAVHVFTASVSASAA